MPSDGTFAPHVRRVRGSIHGLTPDEHQSRRLNDELAAEDSAEEKGSCMILSRGEPFTGIDC